VGLEGRKRWLIAAAALGAVVAALTVAVTGGDDPPAPVAEEAAESPAPREVEEREPEGEEGARPQHGEDPHAEAPPPLEEAELSSTQREVVRTVRAYIEGLDARDGEAVCGLLAPGAISEVELPRPRGGCAESLRASIGYRDPRGLPVWDSVAVRGLLTVTLDGERASATVTTVTRFADRDQPSIEDDVVHLRREGGRWRIAKASSTLYRAVGIADVPPRVLASP
jgi:hypothetical protein